MFQHSKWIKGGYRES